MKMGRVKRRVAIFSALRRSKACKTTTEDIWQAPISSAEKLKDGLKT